MGGICSLRCGLLVVTGEEIGVIQLAGMVLGTVAIVLRSWCYLVVWRYLCREGRWTKYLIITVFVVVEFGSILLFRGNDGYFGLALMSSVHSLALFPQLVISMSDDVFGLVFVTVRLIGPNIIASMLFIRYFERLAGTSSRPVLTVKS